MTRTITCDVCGVDKDISNADDYFVLQIPHRNLEEEIDEPLVVDVCSLECLGTVVQSLQPGEAVPQPTPSEPEPQPAPDPRSGAYRPNGVLRPQQHVGTYEGEVTVR